MDPPAVDIAPVRWVDMPAVTRLTYASMIGHDRQFTAMMRRPLWRWLGYLYVPLYLRLGGRGIKAVKQGQLVGCAFLDRRRVSLYVFNVSVRETHRRQGVGRCLMRQAAVLARAEGLNWLALYVDRDNLAALKLYESVGFRPYNAHLLRGPMPRTRFGQEAHVRPLSRRVGRILFDRYSQQEIRHGDAWALPVVSRDYRLPPPGDGGYWHLLWGGREIGVTWAAVQDRRLSLALRLQPRAWGDPAPVLGLLSELAARLQQAPERCEIYPGSGTHLAALTAGLRPYGFVPRLQLRLLMLQPLS